MYEYHLLFNNGEDLHFPVPLSAYNIKSGSSNETVTLKSFGELPLFGERKLKEWSISGIFPARQYPFCQVQILEKWDYVAIIERIKEEKHNCRFIITGTNINIPCTIGDFDFGEQDGSGDIYFNIKMREFRML